MKTADVSSILAPINGSALKNPSEKRPSALGSSVIEPAYELNDNDDLMIIKSYSLKRAFELLLNTVNHNTILVDKTSIIVGILRKIQKWNIASVINEYRLFAGKNCNYFAETFLEMVSIRIIQEEENGGLKSIEGSNAVDADDLNESKSCAKWEIINESDLSSPPSIPLHLLQTLEEVQADNKEAAFGAGYGVPLMKTQSDLGIFGNRYRLAFNKTERADYEFYKAGEHNILTLNIPKESLLPHWFVRQRDLWENENAQEEHNFYKESIFI